MNKTAESKQIIEKENPEKAREYYIQQRDDFLKPLIALKNLLLFLEINNSGDINVTEEQAEKINQLLKILYDNEEYLKIITSFTTEINNKSQLPDYPYQGIDARKFSIFIKEQKKRCPFRTNIRLTLKNYNKNLKKNESRIFPLIFLQPIREKETEEQKKKKRNFLFSPPPRIIGYAPKWDIESVHKNRRDLIVKLLDEIIQLVNEEYNKILSALPEGKEYTSALLEEMLRKRINRMKTSGGRRRRRRRNKTRRTKPRKNKPRRSRTRRNKSRKTKQR